MWETIFQFWQDIFLSLFWNVWDGVGIGFDNSFDTEQSAIGLNHWGWVTHICVSDLAIIGSDNGLSPGRHQAIIWTNAG